MLLETPSSDHAISLGMEVAEELMVVRLTSKADIPKTATGERLCCLRALERPKAELLRWQQERDGKVLVAISC